MAKGWHNESRRHALASKGIKTAVANPMHRVMEKTDQEKRIDFIKKHSPEKYDKSFKEMINRASLVTFGVPYKDLKTQTEKEYIESGVNRMLVGDRSRGGYAGEYEKYIRSGGKRPLRPDEKEALEEKETPIYQGETQIGTVEDKSKLWSELANFSGTEQYYKGYMGVKETDGVHYLGAKAGWLVSDAETIVKVHPKVRGQEFVAVKIKAKDNKASITYEDGNNNKLYTQRYGYAEIPDGEQTLFYTDGVLMLAGEY